MRADQIDVAVKANDGATLSWTLDPKPATVTSARVIMRRSTVSGPAVAAVDRPGSYDPATGTVTIALTPTETSVPGTYRVEVTVEPGPITFPSDGYDTVRIVPDLG